MKGQIFVLGAVALVIAIFALLPNLQGSLFLPEADTSLLENIATEYNYWISQVSVSDSYDPMAFGGFVKKEYPYVSFFYVLADEKQGHIFIANFFDEPLNFSVNGKGFLVAPNSSVKASFEGTITLYSGKRNFTYSPKNDFSGAIFLESGSSASRVRLLKKFE